MLMLARNNYSLPDGKCVGRTSVHCKAEATGATGAKLSEGSLDTAAAVSNERRT